MRISIIAAVLLVLLAGFVGYYLGAQQRHVEPDAWGITKDNDRGELRSFAFPNRYLCEISADKTHACKPLTFAQAHARGFELIPLDYGCSQND